MFFYLHYRMKDLQPGFRGVLQGSIIKPLKVICGTSTPLHLSWINSNYHNLFSSLSEPLRSLMDLNPIESIFFFKVPLLHCMPLFYKAILAPQGPPYLDNFSCWESDLQLSLTDWQKDKIIQLSHISSISSKMAEVNYKY